MLADVVKKYEELTALRDALKAVKRQRKKHGLRSRKCPT